ncbi:hypothetical protein OA505_01175 [Alphaproteobacteria bacterium]|nr:hypothetical protein [Alphaproteobacteria bacterium]
MLLSSKLVKFIVVATFLTNTSVVFGNDIEKFASKLFNHYQCDDKINKYLKSFFSFGNPKANKSLVTKNGYSNSDTKSSKHTFKIKSKNKMIYSFGNGQSFQMNPSKVNDKIIYNNSPFSYFEFKKNSVLYRINIDF